MEKKLGTVIKQRESQNVVFDYHPREFPLSPPRAAYDFVSGQQVPSSDFQISDLVAKQAGVAALSKQKIEEKLEQQAFDRLKVVEEAAYKEAYELGRTEGAEQAFAEKIGEFEERLQKLDGLLKMFESLKHRLFAENEVHFVKLMFAAAERIAMKEISESPDAILPVLSEVIEDIQSIEDISIKISPEDFNFIQSTKDRLNQDFDFLKRVKLESSENIQPGGCIIDTNFGTIDASIEERVKKVWSLLAEKLPRIKQGNTDGDPQGSSDSSDNQG